jgi:hypothetical protein
MAGRPPGAGPGPAYKLPSACNESFQLMANDLTNLIQGGDSRQVTRRIFKCQEGRMDARNAKRNPDIQHDSAINLMRVSDYVLPFLAQHDSRGKISVRYQTVCATIFTFDIYLQEGTNLYYIGAVTSSGWYNPVDETQKTPDGLYLSDSAEDALCRNDSIASRKTLPRNEESQRITGEISRRVPHDPAGVIRVTYGRRPPRGADYVDVAFRAARAAPPRKAGLAAARAAAAGLAAAGAGDPEPPGGAPAPAAAAAAAAAAAPPGGEPPKLTQAQKNAQLAAERAAKAAAAIARDGGRRKTRRRGAGKKANTRRKLRGGQDKFSPLAKRLMTSRNLEKGITPEMRENAARANAQIARLTALAEGTNKPQVKAGILEVRERLIKGLHPQERESVAVADRAKAQLAREFASAGGTRRRRKW